MSRVRVGSNSLKLSSFTALVRRLQFPWFLIGKLQLLLIFPMHRSEAGLISYFNTQENFVAILYVDFFVGNILPHLRSVFFSQELKAKTYKNTRDIKYILTVS